MTDGAAGGMSPPGGAIRVGVLSDTQTMTMRAPDRYLAAASWLADHRAELDLVVHVGDVVNDGAADPAQFEVAARAHRTVLDAGIPLLVAPGNHDYDDMLDATRKLTAFNRHVGYHMLSGQPSFGHTFEAGCAANSYLLLDGGILAMALEFGPRPAVVRWADGVLGQHPERTVVLVTHSYLDGDGERTGLRSRYHPRSFRGSMDGLDGEELWCELIRRHPQVAMVLCGHQIPGPVAYRVDTGDAGNPVLQSYQNWQCAPDDLLGYLRLIAWQPDAVTVRVVDTATGTYLDGVEHPGYHARIDLSPAGAVRYPASAEVLDAWPAGR